MINHGRDARFWLVAFLFTQLCRAQPPPTILKLQDQSIVTEEGAWIYIPLGEEPAVVQTPGKERRWVTSAVEGRTFGFRSARNGFLWDIRRTFTAFEGKAKGHAFLYCCSIGTPETVWERVAEIDTTSGVPHYLVPLDRPGWFLGIGPYTGFFKEGRASHAALFRRTDEKLVFEDLVDIPFGGRTHIGELESVVWPQPAGSVPKGPNEEPRKFQKTIVRPSSLSPDLWVPCLLPDHLVLGATKAGVLWIFSLNSGQCQRIVDLGAVSQDELDKIDHLDHFLLAIQPNKHQGLIAVTRQPETLVFARALYTPPGVSKEVREGNKMRFLEIMGSYTRLQWWSIDPKSGSKERIDDPSFFPERVITFAQASQFKFLIGPDGHVHANDQASWKDELTKLGLDKRNSLSPPNTVKGESDSKMPVKNATTTPKIISPVKPAPKEIK